MPLDFPTIFSLLARSNEHGVKIALADGDLSVKYPKSKRIDPELLEEIKLHKIHLIEYFKNYGKESSNADELPLITLKVGGEKLYPITPVQTYWVNQEKDKAFKESEEEHGTSFTKFNVKGDFNIAIFREAVRFLVSRHESLRSTFHLYNKQYLLKVLSQDSPLFGVQFEDETEVSDPTSAIQKYITYDEHQFDLSRGPLFLARAIKTADRHHIVSFKVHHVIFDTWSEEILLRDLKAAYHAIHAGESPSLPMLGYQLKEYLALVNHHSKINHQAHKDYWDNLYDHTPEELFIPGSRPGPTPMKEKICQEELYTLYPPLVDKLNALAKEFGVSMFVIIQSVFKYFLKAETRQLDIVIGTYVFGREYPGTEDQIGCYAKTVLIRTVLNAEDSLRETIIKVRKSNADMRQYTAYTLMERMESLLAPHENVYGSFWKINLQYNDQHRSYLSTDDAIQTTQRQDFDLIPIYEQGNKLIAIDLQLEFCHANKNLDLRVCYDSSLYDATTVRGFIYRFLDHALAAV